MLTVPVGIFSVLSFGYRTPPVVVKRGDSIYLCHPMAKNSPLDIVDGRIVVWPSLPNLLHTLAAAVGVEGDDSLPPDFSLIGNSNNWRGWRLADEDHHDFLFPGCEPFEGVDHTFVPSLNRHDHADVSVVKCLLWIARMERLLNDGGDCDTGKIWKDGCCWVVGRGPGSERIVVQPEEGDGYGDQGVGFISASICKMEDPAAAMAAIEKKMGVPGCGELRRPGPVGIARRDRHGAQ